MNQDHLYASLEPVGNLPNIFLVADGMGGHKAGGYASSCAVETILKEVEICPDKDAREILTRAIRRANEVIAHRAGEDERFSGMGTTVVAACLEKGELIAANVGDSRLYVIHEDSIEQVTEDHSLVQEIIVDADAINAVAQDKSALSECACDLIFTPHAAEAARLTGLDISYIEENRIEVSRECSEELGAVILLKGHHTIVTSEDLTQYINNTGNPGMASGGSGDVLAGITAALAARGIGCAEAAAAAAYIHGAAGDIAAEKYGEESMSAADILDCLPETISKLLRG